MSNTTTSFTTVDHGQHFGTAIAGVVAPFPVPWLTTILFATTIAGLVCAVNRQTNRVTGKSNNDGLVFTANKRFSWEPSYFSRLRWITNAQKIIDDADARVSE